MDYAEFRRASLRTFLGFLALTAAIAVVSVLGGDFGETQVKVLLTTLTISAASMCAMACAAFIEKREQRELGLAGISLAIVSALLTILGIWSEASSERYWKLVLTFVVFAVAFAHVFMLLLPSLSERHSWFQALSSVSIAILACQIIFAFWAEVSDDFYYRLLAVVSIIVALETLTVPILMKLGRGQATRGRTIVLEEVGNGVYKDSAGKLYTVVETGPGTEGT
ncbi:MAG: hypothetical protein HN849_31770 [Victivallales bacterium]|nr:hypothetical protein [Victivallales bacterium]